MTAEQAGNALRQLRPFLVVKADEADVAIRFQDELDTRKLTAHPKRKLTPEEEETREMAYRELRALKLRTYDET